jgi:type II secretory ATPase GspE/PulE/Tfp pilus assembly ATPase PilB-like protein
MADEPTEDEDVEWLETKAAAEFLGISERRLHQLRKRGEIAAERLAWKRWRFRIADLMDYVRRSADRMTALPVTETPESSADTNDTPPRASVIAAILKELGPSPQPQTNEEDVQEVPIVRLANAILATAIDHNASEIHIEPDARCVRIRVRVDGFMQEMAALPKHLEAPLLQRYKVMASCKPLLKMLIQRGHIPIRHNSMDYDIRLDILPTLYGESTLMRSYRDGRKLRLNRSGLSLITQAALEEYLMGLQGLILFVSPKAEGNTTTAYACLNKLNALERKICAIEEVTSYRLPGILQTYLQTDKRLTWKSATEAALRQSADVLFLGDIRDTESLEAALFAAESGVLTLACLTAPSTEIALHRLSQWGFTIDRVKLLLRGLLMQRLVRTPCPDCRTEYEAVLHSPLHAMERVSLLRAVGCERCFQSGYKGRTGVFEILSGDPEMWERSYPPIAEDLYQKVRDGVTTVEEAQRVRPGSLWVEVVL